MLWSGDGSSLETEHISVLMINDSPKHPFAHTSQIHSHTQEMDAIQKHVLNLTHVVEMVVGRRIVEVGTPHLAP